MSVMNQYGRTKSVVKRSKKYLEEALYLKLFREGSSDLSVRQQLNQFIKSGKRVYKWEVGDTLKKLRHRNLYNPALKLSDTTAKRNMIKTVSDQAIHLDLIAKARGIAAAEKYFVNLPESAKNHLCYGALLNCYCKELMAGKAEGVMEKMKELGLPLTSMPYNSLMTLYTKVGQPEKIESIIQEMKSTNVVLDSYTYNVWMRALAAVNDISGVERVIAEMKRDGQVTGDWTTYSNLASIFIDAGQYEKAETALKELEKRNARKDLSAYQFLITLYGRTGNILEVYRVLVNLKDLPGAEKCFREWECSCPTYDIRVANVLIREYAKLDMLEKAEELKERARRRGAKPNAKTLEIFSDYHLRKGDFKLAVDFVEKAISVGRGNGKKYVPSSESIGIIMRHFEKEKDVDGAEEFVTILKKSVDSPGAEVFQSLIRTYAAAGRTSSAMQRRLKMENVIVDEATKKLLEVISVE
ncbi:putative tetratricopeptide-like helical domain-containing protein [Lupinus albus]|uniref:Putative tetratricopeptide-like helical domain-containing protein n=1 Tax=Lupinus albus TaxID=3870 RepID=A0A6A4QMD2_LUPAL|nr:putative tetratricopeptide-like helical domain-containing protein [Lupinus albus]